MVPLDKRDIDMMVSLSKYWDLKLDRVYRRSYICSKMLMVETGVSMYWIGNWVGSYPMCYFISTY